MMVTINILQAVTKVYSILLFLSFIIISLFCKSGGDRQKDKRTNEQTDRQTDLLVISLAFPGLQGIKAHIVTQGKHIVPLSNNPSKSPHTGTPSEAATFSQRVTFSKKLIWIKMSFSQSVPLNSA